MINIFTRKNFSEKVKLKIIKKAAKCQMCGSQTDYGECAHIVAAGKDGPRNKQQLVLSGIISEDYSINDEKNGLYLCANCHKTIDRCPDKYSYEYLTQLRNSVDNIKVNVSIDEATKCSNFSQSKQEDHNVTHDICNETICKNTKQYHEIMGIECDSCGKYFQSKQALNYHVEHNVCQHKYQCLKCAKVFTSKRRLIYHTDHNVCTKKSKNKDDGQEN